jgi:CMD domain protein
LHERPRILDFHALRLAEQGGAALVSDVHDVAVAGRAQGPYGAYPPGPLSAEDQTGLGFVVAPETRRVIGPRLGAALEHAHLLVFHPRDASPSALQALLDAGWTTTGVVTLSQLVAFLSFQIRVIDGLSVLGTQKDEAR